MENFFGTFPSQTFLQLLLAVLLGAFVGLERELRRKEAGMRTYALVSLGAALFVVVAVQVMEQFSAMGYTTFDPTRILQAVAMGIGFLGTGIIIFRDPYVAGATTAAGVWVAAGIGAAVGFQLYWIAVIASFLALFVLASLRKAEEQWIRKRQEQDGEQKKSTGGQI